MMAKEKDRLLGDLPVHMKGAIMRAISTWAIKTGLVMVDKYLTFSNLNNKGSVLLIMDMLVDGMVDCACGALTTEGGLVTPQFRTVISTVSRRMLGSIEHQFHSSSPEKEQAVHLSKRWKQLQEAKKSFLDQERKARKTQGCASGKEPAVSSRRWMPCQFPC